MWIQGRVKNYRKRKYSHRKGIIAEYVCATWLILKGYSILYMRYRNYGGEIDIIAAKGKSIAFIEVKARADLAAALYSVSPVKQKVIARAAQSFLAHHQKYAHLNLRFDVMVLTSFFKIRHIQSAWRIE